MLLLLLFLSISQISQTHAQKYMFLPKTFTGKITLSDTDKCAFVDWDDKQVDKIDYDPFKGESLTVTIDKDFTHQTYIKKCMLDFDEYKETSFNIYRLQDTQPTINIHHKITSLSRFKDLNIPLDPSLIKFSPTKSVTISIETNKHFNIVKFIPQNFSISITGYPTYITLQIKIDNKLVENNYSIDFNLQTDIFSVKKYFLHYSPNPVFDCRNLYDSSIFTNILTDIVYFTRNKTLSSCTCIVKHKYNNGIYQTDTATVFMPLPVISPIIYPEQQLQAQQSQHSQHSQHSQQQHSHKNINTLIILASTILALVFLLLFIVIYKFLPKTNVPYSLDAEWYQQLHGSLPPPSPTSPTYSEMNFHPSPPTSPPPLPPTQPTENNCPPSTTCV